MCVGYIRGIPFSLLVTITRAEERPTLTYHRDSLLFIIQWNEGSEKWNVKEA